MTVNIRGTPAYMAPEAASGDLRTPVDVYCFGVVLLQVASGLKTHDEHREEKNIVSTSEASANIWNVEPKGGANSCKFGPQ